MPGHVVVNHEVLFVSGEELGRPGIVNAQPAVKAHDGLERPSYVQAIVRHRPYWAAKLSDRANAVLRVV